MAETTEEAQSQETSDETPERIVKTTTFRGRKIRVHTPTPEQVMVWQRIMNRFSEVEDDINGEQALAMMNRARKIVDTILVDDKDTDWLDDQMLDGKLGFDDLTDLMVQSVKLLSKGQKTGGSGPQSSARRKKAKGKS